MKKLDLNQMENIEGGEFWGPSYSCSEGGTCTRTYHVFWIPLNPTHANFGENCETMCNSYWMG